MRRPRCARIPGWAASSLAAILAAGVVAVVVAAIAGGLSGAPAATSDVASATDAGDVLGADPGSADTILLEETFDELPMDSKLAAPWVVEGGDGAGIVPLPTSVDRSVRIRSSVDGDAASACRPLGLAPEAPARIGLDVKIGGRPPDPVRLLTIEGSDLVVVIGVNPGGEIIGLEPRLVPTGPRSSPEPGAGGDWHRIVVHIDHAAKTVGWAVRDGSGSELLTGSAPIPDGASASRLCLFSPRGAPSGWIAIDDLVVRG